MTKQTLFYFFILIFLFTIPQFCHADMSVGAMAFVFFFPPTLFLLSFFIVWAVESIVIKDRLEENPKRALKISFLINLLSTILGYLIFRFFNIGFFDILFEPFLNFIIFLFVGTFVVEGIILSLFYSKVGIGEIWTSSFIMNVLSYILLFGLYIDSRPTGRNRAKDAAFKATASSLIPVGIICCENPGADFIVPPVNGGLICSTSPASPEVWPDNTKIDNISIVTTCQPDGSFKLRVEPGSSYTGGDCAAADCNQERCTYTGC